MVMKGWIVWLQRTIAGTLKLGRADILQAVRENSNRNETVIEETAGSRLLEWGIVC